MSGSLLDEKENVNCANEFAKEGDVFSTGSILRPSQKQNVCQLTPKKAPKVNFKNTPQYHHPERYRAEHQPNQLLDTWEEIRSLDEVENWTERTQIVTKEDHQFHLDSAKEFLDNIIDNLPCFKNLTKEQQIVEICEETKDSTMDDGLDLAGPLDPAIASLNSLLKAGEEEERAFSPIGSGNVSPDCDNMVTSDDIEKLLTHPEIPDDMEIPSLELLHGNKIDALMDSKFSGRHLDEVAAKLSELKLSSTTVDDVDDLPVKPRGPKITLPTDQSNNKMNGDDFDLPVKPRGAKQPLIVPQEEKKNDDDFDLPVKPRGAKQPVIVPQEEKKNDDVFDLPVKPRGAKQPPNVPQEEKKDEDDFDFPVKPRGAKQPTAAIVPDDFDLPIRPRGAKPNPQSGQIQEEKIHNDERKENGDEEDSLPVKRRQPTAIKSNEQVNGEEKEFKKPMPPKPWKTKKKKAPQNDDPFAVMFAEPAKSISCNEKNSSNGEKASEGSTTVEQKPSSDSKPFENDGADNKAIPTGMDGIVLSDQQDDFGLTNDDFQSGSSFSLELDYLEKFGGNSNNMDRMSALARQSLYVKFDPLCKGRSPDQQGLQKAAADANSLKNIPGNVDDLLMNTPPNRRAPTSKLSSIKESSGNSPSALSSVDRLLTFSPAAKGAPSSTQEVTQTSQQPEPPQKQEDDASLVQPLLYSKGDIEVAVKKEREALLKQTHEESHIKDMEIKEIVSKLQTEVESNSKLKRENDELKTVMKEYEKTMAEMIESTEKDKNVADQSKQEIVKERDQLQADLNSVEAAFSDLHRRYEKMKGTLENYKKNEDILKKAAQDYQEKLRKSSDKYQMLKKHAEEKIETANIEINRVRRSNDSEMAVMRAALKKEQNKSASLEQAVQQKINENNELTAICDELIQRASGK